VIVHQGYSAHKGHYYCYIRPNNQDEIPMDGDSSRSGSFKSGAQGGNEASDDQSRCYWYRYDDESVKLIEDIESQMLST